MTDPAVTTIRAATLDRWDDVVAVLGGDGDRGCWCQPWRGKDDVARATGEARPQTLRRQMEDLPPPGHVAYLDGVPVGWVGVSTRMTTARRVGVQASGALPGDSPLPWFIGCFRIRAGYRRRGLAGALLRGVVEAARAARAPAVMAFPIDPAGSRVEVGGAYVGIASMFDAAGFTRIEQVDAHSAHLPRILVRLDL